MNPAKGQDKFAHDLIMGVPADLKSCRTPWRESASLFGIDSDYAVSLNDKDVVRYRELYPTINIIFDVAYPNYKATHMTDIWRILRIIDACEAHRHEYKNRINDTAGNAKISWIFDVRNLPILK